MNFAKWSFFGHRNQGVHKMHEVAVKTFIATIGQPMNFSGDPRVCIYIYIYICIFHDMYNYQ